MSDNFLKKLIAKTARIARDFIKLRKLIFSATHHPDEAGIKNALGKQLKEIIKEDEIDVHAEMRMISKLQKSNPTPSNYIGISKLCCDKCGLAVDVMQIETRGKHGQGYGWSLPKFIKDDVTTLKNYMGDIAYDLYEKFEPSDKQAFLEHIQDKESAAFPKEDSRHGRRQCADTSSSDDEFGIPPGNDKDLHNSINEFPFNLIWTLREIKQQHPQRLRNLLRGGFELKEAVLLYVEDEKKFISLSLSEEKVLAMSKLNVIKLIQKDEANESLLSEAYDISPHLFWFIVNNKHGLLDDFGIHEVMQRYRAIIYRLENDVFYDSDQEHSYSRDESIFNTIIYELKKEYGYDYSSNSDADGDDIDSNDDCHSECELYPDDDDDDDESFKNRFSSMHIK